jgi:hypothetical protein
MTLRDIGKSVYLNMADPPYGYANWTSRIDFVQVLRDAAKQLKRFVDLGSTLWYLSEITTEQLDGSILALEFAAETFELLSRPILDVRQIIERRRDELESKILSYKQELGFEKDFNYYGAQVKVLQKILDATKEMEDEDNRIIDDIDYSNKLIVGEI